PQLPRDAALSALRPVLRRSALERPAGARAVRSVGEHGDRAGTRQLSRALPRLGDLARDHAEVRPLSRRVPARARGRRMRRGERVIVGLPEWNLNGVCVFSANLVRGLRARGMDARIFLTEEQTPLVTYPRVGPPVPEDLVVDRLRLTAHDRWSEAWSGIERYLEEQAPCVYIP